MAAEPVRETHHASEVTVRLPVPSAGRKIGNYELLQPLGQGGMDMSFIADEKEGGDALVVQGPLGALDDQLELFAHPGLADELAERTRPQAGVDVALADRQRRGDLPFGDFLEPSVRTTQTKLKSFPLDQLPKSDAVKVILDWLLNDGDFLLKEK